jgi:hypothetical protein
MKTQQMKLQRALRWIALVAKTGYWIDKFWRQLQRHQVFSLQLDAS